MKTSHLSKLISLFFCNFRRTLLTLSGATALVILCVLSAVAWIASSELLAPPRKPLQAYHKKILKTPRKYGITITPFTAACNTPCLVITNDQTVESKKAKSMQSLMDTPSVNRTQPFGNIILLHGRKGRKEDLLSVAERFCSLGFRCICLDLPAHGDHPSNTSTYGIQEAELIKEIYSDIKATFNIPEKEPEFLLGFSMGGAVSIRAAATDDEWDGLITVSTFATLNETIDREVERRSSLLSSTLTNFITCITNLRSSLNTSSVNSEQLIKKANLPTMIIHGEKDPLIPLNDGKRLLNASPSSYKQLIVIPKARHANALALGGDRLYADISNFLLLHNKAE